MSSETPIEEIEHSLKHWSSMVNQMAVDVTDKATLQGYKDNNVKYVEWVSENDSKRCNKCKELDGKIFPIDEAPAKQHNNCRCFLIPA